MIVMQYDTIEIYVTDGCQLACSGCELHKGKQSLTVEQVRRIYNSGILGRTKEISILGGEPTQWPFLGDFLELCRSANAQAKIEITTNGIDVSDEIITSCRDYGVAVNVSYHGMSDIVDTIVRLKKKGVFQKSIIVPAIDNVKNISDVYKLLSNFGKCVCRPFVGGESQKSLVKYLNTEMMKENLPMESGVRRVNREMKNNVELIIKAAQEKGFYHNFRCKCGKNGVIYTDGKLYHCLSQAMKSYKPLSMKQKEEFAGWLTCNFEYCSCDTFQLMDKDRK